MRVLWMIWDGFVESQAKRIFWALLLISTLVIITAAGLGLSNREPEQAFEKNLEEHILRAYEPKLESFREADPGSYIAVVLMNPPVTQKVTQEPGMEHVPARFIDPLVFGTLHGEELAAKVAEFFQGAGYERVGVELQSSDYAVVAADETPVGPEEGPRRAQERLRLHIVPGEDTTGIKHGKTISWYGVSFGGFDFDMSGKEVVAITQSTLADWIAGVFGVLAAILVTANFVPDMLSDGRIQILLSRRVTRWEILLGKYLGAVSFVLVHAAYLITGLWLATSLRFGVWNMDFPWAGILSIVGLFAIIYAVSLFAGILFENGIICIIASIGFWFFCWAVNTTRTVFTQLETDSAWYTELTEGLYWVLPKTKDLSIIFSHYMTRDLLTPRALKMQELAMEKIDIGASLGSSAAFTAAVIGLGLALFYRREY